MASAALRQDPLQLDPPACDCGSEEIYISEHSDGCDTKEYFRALSECSVDEIGEYWNAVPYSARSFVLDCIKADNVTKYAQAVESLAPYYGYKAETPAGNNTLSAIGKVESTVASLKEPTWDDLDNVYKALELAYSRAFRNDDLKTTAKDLEMIDARFDAMEAYLLAVYKYSKFAQNPNDIVMMDSSSSSGGNSVRFDSSVTAGKWVSTSGEDYKLTLESWVGGFSMDLSRPSDIVLVLDQSASMYTPVGVPFALWHYKIYEDSSEYLERYGATSDDTLEGILNMLAKDNEGYVDETTKLTYAEKFAQLGYLVAQSRVGGSEYCTTEEHVHTDRDANICGISAHVHDSSCWANCTGDQNTYNVVSFHNCYYQWAYSVGANDLYNTSHSNDYNIDKAGVHFKLYPIGDNYFRVAAVSDKTNYTKVSELRGTGSFKYYNAIAHAYISIIKPTQDHPLLTLEIGDVVRINTNGNIDLAYPNTSTQNDNGYYDAGGGSWAKGSVTIDIIADSFGVGAGWFAGDKDTVSTGDAFGENGNAFQAFGYNGSNVTQEYPRASQNVLGTTDYRLTDGKIVSQYGVNNLSDAGYVKFKNTAGGKANAWIRLNYNDVYYDATSTSTGWALGQTRRFDTFTVYGFSGVGYGVPENVVIWRYRTSLGSWEMMANTTIYYEYGNDYGYKVVVRLDDVIENEDLIAIQVISETSYLLIDEIEAAYCNRVPYNIVEDDACYGTEAQLRGTIVEEGSYKFYSSEFGTLHHYNVSSVANHGTDLSAILTDGNKNVEDVGNANNDSYLRFRYNPANANDIVLPYLIFDLGEESDNNRSRTYKIYGAGLESWGVVTPETDAHRFQGVGIYVSNDKVNWTKVDYNYSYKIVGDGTGYVGESTGFDLYEVTYNAESFQYGRYVKFEFGDCNHLWMSEIEIIREYDANSDIDVRYYNRTGSNHQHDDACADCGYIEHEHVLQCGFTCQYETHTHERCELNCFENHDHTDSCYTCGKPEHTHESKTFICTLTKEQILAQNHVHGYGCYSGEGCLYCKPSHTHDEECESLATCGKVAHIHNVDCIGGKAGGCQFDEHVHDDVECYRTAQCKETFLRSGGHSHHTEDCFTCGYVPHEHDYRCGMSCFYIEDDVMYPYEEHFHSPDNLTEWKLNSVGSYSAYDRCWTYDWFVVQYDMGANGTVDVYANDDGTYTISADSDDFLKMYRTVVNASPAEDSNQMQDSLIPSLDDNCLIVPLDELGKNQFYFYKSQTGALVDSLAMFLNNLNDSGMNHRVAIAGFASETYSQKYTGGTGLYINGEFKSFIQTEGLVDGLGNPTEFIDYYRTYDDDYIAMHKQDPVTYPEYYAAQKAWAEAVEAGTDDPTVLSGDEPLSYRNLKAYTLLIYNNINNKIISTGNSLITEQDYQNALMPLNPQYYQEEVTISSDECFENVMNSLFAVKTDYYYTNQYLGMYMATQIFENAISYDLYEKGDYDMNPETPDEDLRQRMVVMFTDGVAQQNAMDPSNDAYKYQSYTIDKVLEYSREMEQAYGASVYTICTSTVNVSEYATEDVSYLYYSTSDFAGGDTKSTVVSEPVKTVLEGKEAYPLTTENISKLKKFMRVESSTQMIDAFNAVLADAGGSYVQLDKKAIAQDVINENFVLSAELVDILNQSIADGKVCNTENYPEIKDYIKVYTVEALDGSEYYYYTFPEGTEGYEFDADALANSDSAQYVNLYEEAEIEIGINQSGRQYLRVANFDYAEHFVSAEGRDTDEDGVKDYWGKKLMTVIPIEVAEDNLGGNDQETNYSDAYGEDEYDFSGVFYYQYSVNGELIGNEKLAEFAIPIVDIQTNVTIESTILNGDEDDTLDYGYTYKKANGYETTEWSGNHLILNSITATQSEAFGSKYVVNDVRADTEMTLEIPADKLKYYDIEFIVYERVDDDYTGDVVLIDRAKYKLSYTTSDSSCAFDVTPGMFIKINAVKKNVGSNVKLTHNFYVAGEYVGKVVDYPVVDVKEFTFAPYNGVVSVSTDTGYVSLDASEFEVALISANSNLTHSNGVYTLVVQDGEEYEIVFDYHIEAVMESVDGEVGVNQSASAIEGDGLYDVITTVTSKGNSRPIDIVFVVDVSSGMSEGVTDTKLAQAKAELREYIANSYALNENVRVAIITYADNYTVVTNGYVTTEQDALAAVDEIKAALDNSGNDVDTSNLQSGLYAARNLINSEAIGSYTDVIVIKGSAPNASYAKLATADAYNYSTVKDSTAAEANMAADWEIARMAMASVSQIDLTDEQVDFDAKMTEIFDTRNYINVNADISITVNYDEFKLIESAGIFVDFNGNGEFDETERLTAEQYTYSSEDGVITIHLGTLREEVKIKHTLELINKVNGDYFVSDEIEVSYDNSVKGIRETAMGVSPRVTYNKTTVGATITIIPYLSGEGDVYRPLGDGGLTVKISKEDAIIGEPIVYKASGVTNLTAGNTYTVKAPVLSGYTLWETYEATQEVEINSEGGNYVVYFPYYQSGALVDDSIVYDESAPTVFDVLENDKQPDGETFKIIYGIGFDENIVKDSTVVETENGKLELVDGKLKYTTKGIKAVTEVFYYAVEDAYGKLRIGTIYVVPATIVKIDSSDDAQFEKGDRWQIMDNNGNIVNGDPNDYISNKNPNDADDIYGGDKDSYTSQFKFDAGYALYANRYQDYIANGEVDGTTEQYTTTFSFEGTGFDIISVTGSSGGYMRIETYDESGAVVKSATGNIKTYSNAGDIYQATVFTCTDLTHGKYTVKVIAQRITMPSLGINDAKVFIDSVRVYNPFAENTNEHYNDAHDGTVTSTLRDIFADGLLAIDVVDKGEEFEGVFTLSGNLDINDFVSKGTNHAINIAKGQALLFELGNAYALTSFQVEMAAFQSSATVNVRVNNEVVETIMLDSAIFAYYDFSKYIRENSTVSFEVVDGNVIFSKVRYKGAKLVAPENGNKYQTGELVLSGKAPADEEKSDEYRVNTVYITNSKKEGTRTVTAVVYTSLNADTVIAYTSGYRIAPTSVTVRTNTTQKAFIVSYVIPEKDTASNDITGTIQIDFYAYSTEAELYSSNCKTVNYTFK